MCVCFFVFLNEKKTFFESRGNTFWTKNISVFKREKMIVSLTWGNSLVREMEQGATSAFLLEIATGIFLQRIVELYSRWVIEEKLAETRYELPSWDFSTYHIERCILHERSKVCKVWKITWRNLNWQREIRLHLIKINENQCFGLRGVLRGVPIQKKILFRNSGIFEIPSHIQRISRI